MRYRKMASSVLGMAIAGLVLTAAGVAAAFGCRVTSQFPVPFPVGGATQYICNDISGAGRVQVSAIGATTETYDVRANLLQALVAGSTTPAETFVLNAAGLPLCSSGQDSNPDRLKQAEKSCVTQQTNPGTQYRFQVGDNAGP